MIRRARLALLLCLLALGALAPAVRAATETASRGAVSATLTWTGSGPGAFTTTLSITRQGALLLNGSIAGACSHCAGAGPLDASGGAARSLHVADINRDGEPEVFVELFSGGAHCCTTVLAFSLNPAGTGYVRAVLNTGDLGYRLHDFDRNGQPEFVTDDDRFAYAFTSFAESAFPARVFVFGYHYFLDATRHYRGYVRANARAQLRGLARAKRHRGADLRGLVAAYAADECLLSRCEVGFAQVRSLERHHYLSGRRAQFGHRGRHFLTVVRSFLRKTGYR